MNKCGRRSCESMNMKKRIKALLLTAALLAQSVSAGAFWDVAPEHKAYNDINLIIINIRCDCNVFYIIFINTFNPNTLPNS